MKIKIILSNDMYDLEKTIETLPYAELIIGSNEEKEIVEAINKISSINPVTPEELKIALATAEMPLTEEYTK